MSTFSNIFLAFVVVSHFFDITLNRFDRANRKGVLSGYFLWLIVGYAVGMCLHLR
jgi:hypothetical protein